MSDQVKRLTEKYHRVLDEFEVAERNWDEQRDAVCKALLRLSHLGTGVAETLDDELKKLRRMVQKKRQIPDLVAQVSVIVDTLRTVEESRGEQPELLGLNPAHLLEPVGAFELPRKLRLRVLDLEGMIRSANVSPAEFMREYGEFIKDVLGFLAQRWLGREDQSDPAVSEAAADPEPSNDLELRQAIVNVIDNLPLPEECANEAAEIRARVQAGLKTAALPGELGRLVDMMVAAAIKEKEAFSSIVEQFAQRLGQFSQFLKLTKEDQDSGDSSSQRLDQDLHDHVAGMQKSVENAANLVDLQQSMGQGLLGFLDRIDEFVETERARRRAFGSELKAARASLKTAEEESRVLQLQIKEQRERSLLDPLTRLPNRQSYQLRLRHEYERWSRYGGTTAIAMADLDHFKRINDSYGHLAGDKVLRIVGQVFKKSMRRTDFVARYGGEEFVLIMPGVDAAGGARVCEKVREEMAATPFEFRAQRVQVTMSFGVTDFQKGRDAEATIKAADEALYTAKDSGRNKVTSAA